MSLFYETRAVELTEDEWGVVDRAINGSGGAQGLLRDFHACTTGGRKFLVEDPMLDRVYVYAYRYQGGGFQDRFRAIVKAGLRAGWTPDTSESAVPRRGSGGAFGKAK